MTECTCGCHYGSETYMLCACDCWSSTYTGTSSTTDWTFPFGKSTLSSMLNFIYIVKNNYGQIQGFTNDMEVVQKWVDEGYSYETLNKISEPPALEVSEFKLREIYEILKETTVVNDSKGRFIKTMEFLEELLGVGEDEGDKDE